MPPGPAAAGSPLLSLPVSAEPPAAPAPRPSSRLRDAEGRANRNGSGPSPLPPPRLLCGASRSGRGAAESEGRGSCRRRFAVRVGRRGEERGQEEGGGIPPGEAGNGPAVRAGGEKSVNPARSSSSAARLRRTAGFWVDRELQRRAVCAAPSPGRCCRWQEGK